MIEELIGQFSPESFGEWCREKFDRFTADPHEAPNAGAFPKARIVGYVQSLPDSDVNRPLLVMSVYAGEQISERSSRRKQFDFARKQLLAAIDKPPAKVKGLFTQGLFAFHDKAGNFRLSLVSARADGKKLVYSDFKRQSFFIRPGLNNKTFRSRMASVFDTYGDLTAAFSVETLTKEFYNSLFAWYERAMAPESKVTFPNDLTRDDDDRTQLAEHLIRLITRLMFIWFIHQKNLIPDKIFDPAALKTLLKSFDPASPKQDNYYRAILQNLFFATLNCEIKERDFANEGSFEENREHFGIKLLYRYSKEFACTPEKVIELFRGVPFLNGGLFECLDKKADYQDGFSRNAKRVAHIPNNLFFDEHGLITLFSRYDFTVDENDPNDSDVALDPELLGKVFENLLGAYNPETRETARKQSGSFYTPREIVNYMVDESLVVYIRTQAPEIEEPVIRDYLGGEQPPDLAPHLRHKLVTALYHCRILDPACGSGAFPMGLLLKMVHLLQRLDPKNTLWHEVVMAETEKALTEAETLAPVEKEHRRQRITESFDQNINHPDYARKLYLIENCIFGVDIQPIAVQIAKLRAFITLVCDQEPDLTDAARNYRMLPLPNLETKFVAANSLIGLSSDFAEGLKPGEGGSRLDDHELVRLRAELAEVRHQHFRARNSSDKNACRKRDHELRGKIKTRLVEIACKPDQEKIVFYRTTIERLQKERKRVEREEWKDVIQSRPQQGNLFDSAPAPVQTVMRVDVNKEARDRLDDDLRRNTRAIEAEENRSKNKSAFQKEADTLAAWDPYDQNASSPFFDPQWMFDELKGFNIVIGNPPYISHDRIEHNDVLQTLYVTWSPFADIYCYFAEKGISLLRDGGTLTFITSNSYIKADYGLPLRKLLGSENTILALVNIEDSQIFESAIVNTAIVIVKKGDHSPLTQAIITNDSCETLSFPEYISQKSTILPAERFSGPRWILASEQHLCLLDKIISAGETLKSRGAKIRLGIATGSNDAFIIDGVKRAALVAQNRKNGRILKPILRGRDIKRYVYAASGMYIILAKNGVDVKNEYPDLFAHLDSFGKAFKSRGAKGQQWWNLRACDFYDDFKKEKIVWIELTDKARFALCNDEVYCINSAYFMLPPPNTDCRFLLALLNSRTVEYFVKSYAETSGMGTMRWINNIVSDIPIPDVSPESQTQLIALVDRILTIKKADPAADISDMEVEIDQHVYTLYNLTNDEIAIVEGRGASENGTAVAAKPVKVPAARQPRKSVMTEDPDLS